MVLSCEKLFVRLLFVDKGLIKELGGWLLKINNKYCFLILIVYIFWIENMDYFGKEFFYIFVLKLNFVIFNVYVKV